MKLSSLFALTPIAFALSVNAQTTQSDTVEVKEADVEKIRIVGVRQNRVSRGATGFWWIHGPCEWWGKRSK